MSEPRRIDPAADGRPGEPAASGTENHDGIEDHDRGLLFDIQTLVQRRTVLGLVGGLGVLAGAAACASSGSTTSAATSSASHIVLRQVDVEHLDGCVRGGERGAGRDGRPVPG